jgi:hypothetical protein
VNSYAGDSGDLGNHFRLKQQFQCPGEWGSPFAFYEEAISRFEKALAIDISGLYPRLNAESCRKKCSPTKNEIPYFPADAFYAALSLTGIDNPAANTADSQPDYPPRIAPQRNPGNAPDRVTV